VNLFSKRNDEFPLPLLLSSSHLLKLLPNNFL